MLTPDSDLLVESIRWWWNPHPIAKLKRKDLLLQAWEIQFMGTPERLEEEMFGVSCRAGIAGNYQWGLDPRYHDNWNLYANLPTQWKVGDYAGGEEELEV